MFRPYRNPTEPILRVTRLSADRPTRPVDVTCPKCGRHEAAGAYCTGCGHRYQS
jgi:hypothetical protein